MISRLHNLFEVARDRFLDQSSASNDMDGTAHLDDSRNMVLARSLPLRLLRSLSPQTKNAPPNGRAFLFYRDEIYRVSSD